MSYLGRILVFTSIIAVGCADLERPGGDPTAPVTVPEVVGIYDATSLRVERDGRFTELVGEPETVLRVSLRSDGRVHGQLKIGTDPQLRDKQPLVGEWRYRVPNFVTFDMSPATFLNETAFRSTPPQLTGEWADETVRLRIELTRRADSDVSGE